MGSMWVVWVNKVEFLCNEIGHFLLFILVAGCPHCFCQLHMLSPLVRGVLEVLTK